jgi:hypothetical protein
MGRGMGLRFQYPLKTPYRYGWGYWLWYPRVYPCICLHAATSQTGVLKDALEKHPDDDARCIDTVDLCLDIP